jgi:hypothetical protein
MGAKDGKALGVTTIVDHGAAKSRWNLVIMGDGYRDAELATFATDADNVVAKLKATAPYRDLWPLINVFRIDVRSTDSGADDPASAGGTGATARTFFDASFGYYGNRRLIGIDYALAMKTALSWVRNANMTMIIVNSPLYGGSGGSVATFSKDPSALEIALHEMGHTAFGLADEYETYRGCDSGETDHDRYAAGEPHEPNITTVTDRGRIKWKTLIDPATAIPTQQNPNCRTCNHTPSPVPAGTVGTFEGGYYYHCGIYRPEADCRMRTLGKEYCAVCQAVITQKICQTAGVAPPIV